MCIRDSLTAVFPQQMACQENIIGDIELPDHPLVNQTLEDCLTEAMDVDALVSLIDSIAKGDLNLIPVESVEPSPMAHEILTAKPYTFLDDAPLEERRAQAVYTRRSLDFHQDDNVGKLDLAAIIRVREFSWPHVNSSDELHDALLVLGFLTGSEIENWVQYLDDLICANRVTRFSPPGGNSIWVPSERLPQFQAVFPGGSVAPPGAAPFRARELTWETEPALLEIVRSRMEALGPVTTEDIARTLSIGNGLIDHALRSLEAEGLVFSGRFTPEIDQMEWCDRRVLSRIHRYTLERLRREVEPVSSTDFLRFLFVWQHLDPDHHLEGPTGLVAVLDLLEGFQASAGTWENQIPVSYTNLTLPTILLV